MVKFCIELYGQTNPYGLLNMIIKFMRNGTILTLHIMPNRKLHTISFQMAYNMAVCTVGTLNSSNNAFFGVWPLE